MRFAPFLLVLVALDPSSALAEAPTRLAAEERTLVLDTSVDPEAQAALADIERRSASATALYVSSIVLLGTGALGGAVGLALGFGLSSIDVLGLLWVGAGVALLGHLITMVVAICLDVGSGARRRALEAAHPELGVRVTGGPGDVGLGLGVDF
jgi:hypothetical protein